MGMTIVSFITPKGVSTCSSDGGAGADAGAGGLSGSGAGGSSGSGGGGSSGGGAGEDGGGGGSAGGGGGGSAGGGGGGSAGGGGGGSAGGGGGGSAGSGSSGSAGSGSGGSSGKGGKDAGYAFLDPQHPDRHHVMQLSSGTEEVAFAWHDAPGAAPPADLWLEADGRTVLQVAAVGGAPFVRAGLDIAPLAADQVYHLSVTRDADALVVTVLDASNRTTARTRIDGASTADVVLPAATWRTAIVSDLK